MTIEKALEKLTFAIETLCEGLDKMHSAALSGDPAAIRTAEDNQRAILDFTEQAREEFEIADLHHLAHQLGDLEALEEILESIGVETVNQLDADGRRQMAAEIRTRL